MKQSNYDIPDITFNKIGVYDCQTNSEFEERSKLDEKKNLNNV